MKAEQRKELETNILRRWMIHLKERLQGRALYLIGGTVLLLVAAVVIVLYYRSSMRAADSARLMELLAADSEKKLDEIITSDKNKGKPTVTWAKLQKARLATYREGLDKLGTPDDKMHKAAVAKLEEGRKIYLEIVNDLDPSLQQEAWLACSQVEEALLGTPKDENGTESRGSFDKMIEYMRKAAAINPDSEPSQRYAANADKMLANRTEMVKFYEDLHRLGTTPQLNLNP